MDELYTTDELKRSGGHSNEKRNYADELMRDHQVVTPKKGGIKKQTS